MSSCDLEFLLHSSQQLVKTRRKSIVFVEKSVLIGLEWLVVVMIST